MNILVTSAILVSTILAQQESSQVKQVDPPKQYRVILTIFDDFEDDFELNGARITETTVVAPGEEIAFKPTNKMKHFSRPTFLAISGQAAEVSTGVGGHFDAYRVILVQDQEEILVSLRYLTWTQLEGQDEPKDKKLHASVVEFVKPGSTIFTRVSEHRIVFIEVYKYPLVNRRRFGRR